MCRQALNMSRMVVTKTCCEADSPASSLHTLLGMPSAPGALFGGARRIASVSSCFEIGGKGIGGFRCVRDI